MKASFDNNVVIIGGDHHNTLAVVRCLGKYGCRHTTVIHTNCEDATQLGLSHSKYATDIHCVNECEASVLRWLLDHTTDQKQILFPCSDFAAYVIDRHYEELAPYYVLPGFQQKPGRVLKLMDKGTQSEFAQMHALPQAKTWKLVRAEGFVIPADMVYPCIVKPVISAFGNKSHITICDNIQQLENALHTMLEYGYDQLVVQQFLHKQYEVCAYGCLVDDKKLCAGGTIRKIREYPPRGGGSLTFAQFIDVQEVNELRDKVLDILYAEGYRGQYDVELFVCEEGVYLNEINFRHSGNGYALVKNGVPAPYIWCAAAVGAKIEANIKTKVKTGKYHMDELPDLRHLAEKRISLFSWVGDLMKTSAFSKWDMADIKGTWGYYRPLAKSICKKLFRKGSAK